MSYTISVFDDPERIPELIELFSTGLGETTVDHWKWRLFTENGLPDPAFAVVALDKDGKMAGVSSMLPVIYGSGENERKCLQFCDWVVHPDHRGKGIIKMIYRYACDYFSDKGYDFIMEFPNDNSYPIFQKYGFFEEPYIGCMNTSKRLFFSKRIPSDCNFSGVEIRFTDTCPFTNEEFVSVGRIYRNVKFLRWKYDLNPDTEYRYVSLWKNESCIGYFVYTLTRGRLRTAVNVYDWDYYGSDPDILRKVISLLRKMGNYVSIWGRYDGETVALMNKAGLKDVGGTTRLMLKSLSDKPLPEKLTLTRIDTDY